ncbi:unnamed protein product, partial [marine sediment metagenome]
SPGYGFFSSTLADDTQSTEFIIIQMRKVIGKMNHRAFGFLIMVLSLGLHNSGISQEAVKINRLTSPVVFDGIPNEKAWETLDLFPLTMHRPNFGNQPSEKSDVRIGYDDEFLWIGASLFMEDASKIFAATKKRDEMLFGYDAFGIMLDSYNDNENGLAFFTAPTGLRTDYTISNDALTWIVPQSEISDKFIFSVYILDK